jgi:hypothetical protein
MPRSLSAPDARGGPATPLRSAAATPAPSAPRAPVRYSLQERAPALCRSTRPNAGHAPPPNAWDATLYLQGRLQSKRVESYRKASTRPTTAASSCDVTPATPVVEEEEEANANAPGPSQIRPPMLDRSENPFLANDEPSDNEIDFLCDPEAHMARRLEHDGVGAPPANNRALLAHGLRSVYDLPATNMTTSSATSRARSSMLLPLWPLHLLPIALSLSSCRSARR